VSRKPSQLKETKHEEFARLCAEVKEPLVKLLEHPFMDSDAAGLIVDGLLALSGIWRPTQTPGAMAHNALESIVESLAKRGDAK
jgi:hypothetical protein